MNPYLKFLKGIALSALASVLLCGSAFAVPIPSAGFDAGLQTSWTSPSLPAIASAQVSSKSIVLEALTPPALQQKSTDPYTVQIGATAPDGTSSFADVGSLEATVDRPTIALPESGTIPLLGAGLMMAIAFRSRRGG